MGEMTKFAEKRGEIRPNTAPEQALLARRGANVEWMRSASLIFNQMLICSARPLLRKMEFLIGVSEVDKWKTHFNDVKPYTDDKKEKRLRCLSVKPVLESEFELKLSDTEFKRQPSDLAKHLIKRIGEEYTVIPLNSVKNKLMFFLWDNVFSRDRTPLFDLLKNHDENTKQLRTFGDFSAQVDIFIEAVMKWQPDNVGSAN